MLTIEKFEAVLLVATLAALAARRLRLPYTVGLVVAGMAAAGSGMFGDVPLTKDLIYRILLPPLIFEASLFLRWKDVRKSVAPILTFALAGVVISTGLISAAMWAGAGWTWGAALVFAALIAATDPVAVVALMKDLKVTGRLRDLLEAESLLNDGAAAVLFSLLVIFAAGQSLTPAGGAVLLAQEIGVGIGCGALCGLMAVLAVGRTEDHLVELTVSMAAAFGSFLLAEHFHGSGILSVLAAAMVFINLGRLANLTETGKDGLHSIWEFAAFLSNSIVFLLIGVEAPTFFSAIARHGREAVLAIVAVLAARAAIVYGLSVIFRRSKQAIEVSHQHVLFWGGLKGALSLALALGLPYEMEHREEIVTVTFSVVAFSLLVQGATMPVLLNRLGLAKPESA